MDEFDFQGTEEALRGSVVPRVKPEDRLRTLEALAGLSTPFREGGTVTAGNASGVNDGAAVLLFASGDASGARLALTAALDLHDRGGERACATMCIGVGQGIALALKRP